MIRTDKAPLFCPKEGTEERKPILDPPKSTEDKPVKRWMGRLYAEYLELYKQDEVLLDCWNREQKKRAD